MQTSRPKRKPRERSFDAERAQKGRTNGSGPAEDAGACVHLTRVPKVDIVLPTGPDGSSFETYRTLSATQVQVVLPDGVGPPDFFLDAATYQLPQATLSRVRSCPQIIRRGPGEIARNEPPTVQLCLYVAGRGDFSCAGRRELPGPGDIMIVDSRHAHENRVSAFDLRLVIVPVDRLPPIFLSPRVHGLRLPGDEAGTRLLATSIEALTREIGGLSVPEADGAVAALCVLAAGLVQSRLSREDGDRHRWPDPLLDAGMAYIERRCREAELTPEAVRIHLGVSRSGLYRLFVPLGGIERAIRQRRLDHAMRALLTDASSALPPRDVAIRCGFRNETHFVRAFRLRFGTTPLQVYNKVATGDRDWFVAQAGRAGFASLQAWLEALTSGNPEIKGRADGEQRP